MNRAHKTAKVHINAHKSPIAALFALFLLVLTACGSRAAYTATQEEVAAAEADAKETNSFDLDSAQTLSLADNKTETIDKPGVYILSSTAHNATIVVDIDPSEKVKLILNGAQITNDSAPIIQVKSAGKVYLTSADNTTNTFAVTGAAGAATSNSTAHEASAADSTASPEASSSDITLADDEVPTADPTLLDAATSGDASTEVTPAISSDADLVLDGMGTLVTTSPNSAIQVSSLIRFNGGAHDIKAPTGIEATRVLIDNATIGIEATDAAIHATNAPNNTSDNAATPTIQVDDGDLTIQMGDANNPALNSDGTLYITGGTTDITGKNAFSHGQDAQLTDGTVTVNGEQVTVLD